MNNITLTRLLSKGQHYSHLFTLQTIGVHVVGVSYCKGVANNKPI